MNKKILSSCLVLSLCLSAMAPIYDQLLLSNNFVHSTTGQPGQVSATQQESSSAGYTVTYPQLNEFEALKLEQLDLRQKDTESLLVIKESPVNTQVFKTLPVKQLVSTAKTNTSSPLTTVRQTSASTVKKTTAIKKPTTVTRSTTSTKTAATRTVSSSRSNTTTSVTSKASAILNTAKSFMGVPYIWGGTTPSGFDCSGFIQYVLMKNGISIARTAAEQFAAGFSVSKANLKAGDLVFFTTYKPGPSHVGFYLGDGRFIHCSSSKGVTVTSLSSPYFSGRYIGARRVF